MSTPSHEQTRSSKPSRSQMYASAFGLLFALIVVVLAFLLAVSALDSYRNRDTIICNTALRPSTLSPLHAADENDWVVMDLLWDRLANVDAEGKVLPELALSWTPIKDNTELVVNLNPDATWSDGTKITPQDLVFTWQQHRLQDNYKVFDNYLVRRLLDVRIITTNQVVLVSDQPIANWAPVLYSFVPVPHAGVVSSASVTTSGPYSVAHQSTDTITLVKRKDYMGIHPGKCPKFVFRFPTTSEDTAQIIKDGYAHVSTTSRTRSLLVERGLYGSTVVPQKIKGDDLCAIWLNCKQDATTSDVAVRQALSNLLPWRQISIDPQLYSMRLTTSFWPNSIVPFDSPAISSKPNIEFANCLLSQAGWVPQADGGVRIKQGKKLSLTIYVSEQDQYGHALNGLKDNAKAAGIDLNLQSVPYEDLIKYQQQAVGDGWVISWSFGIDPDCDTVTITTAGIESGFNLSHYSNPKLDTLVVKARAEMNKEARAKLYADISQILVEEAPMLPMTYSNSAYLTSFKLKGFTTDHLGHLHGHYPGQRGWTL